MVFGVIGNLRPNWFEVFALASVCLTTVLFFGSALDAAEAYSSIKPMSGWERVTGLLGWSLTTFGPLTVFIVFWRLSKCAQRPLILHILAFPAACALLKYGDALMLLVIGDPDFDATIGGPVIQGWCLFFLMLIGYYGAVIHSAFKRREARSNDG